jgi:hypothetical protein
MLRGEGCDLIVEEDRKNAGHRNTNLEGRLCTRAAQHLLSILDSYDTECPSRDLIQSSFCGILAYYEHTSGNPIDARI